MTDYNGPDRRQDGTTEQLRRMVDSLDRLRESAHRLRNADTAILLRLDRLEADVRTWASRSDSAQGEVRASPAGRELDARLRAHERRLAAVEAHVAAAQELVNQGRGALMAMRVLAGGSVLTAGAALVALWRG